MIVGNKNQKNKGRNEHFLRGHEWKKRNHSIEYGNKKGNTLNKLEKQGGNKPKVQFLLKGKGQCKSKERLEYMNNTKPSQHHLHSMSKDDKCQEQL